MAGHRDSPSPPISTAVKAVPVRLLVRGSALWVPSLTYRIWPIQNMFDWPCGVLSGVFKWSKRPLDPSTQEEAPMAKPSNLKPGQPAPNSGQYQQIGPRGGKGPEVTVPKGTTLPPTTLPGSTYTLVDPSKNKSGEGK